MAQDQSPTGNEVKQTQNNSQSNNRKTVNSLKADKGIRKNDPALSAQNSQGYGKAQSQVSGGNEGYNQTSNPDNAEELTR